MKQFQVVYRERESFQAVLQEWRKFKQADMQAVIRLCANGAGDDEVEDACTCIRR